MKDLTEGFREYLLEWCKENHKPQPKQAGGKYWKEAWESYMKTRLVPEWEENKKAYLDMTLLTNKMKEQLEKEETKEVEPEQEDTESSWDKVQKMLNK